MDQDPLGDPVSGIRTTRKEQPVAKFTFTVNGQKRTVESDPDTPLLWILRDHLDLRGTKYGCGKSLCGACTVHINGRASRSCSVPISDVAHQTILTIEGLSPGGDHPLQKAWIELNVPQCGFCQPGQLMQAVDLLLNHPDPSDEQIDQAMDGNLCRCGTYLRIRKGIHRAAQITRKV